MTIPQSSTNERQNRLRVLLLGGAGLAVLGVVGAALVIPRVERDLTTRVNTKLAASGLSQVSVAFSGQDAKLSCSAVLGDPAWAWELTMGVAGVRATTIDHSCLAAPTKTVATTTSVKPELVTSPQVAVTSATSATKPAPSTSPLMTTLPRAAPAVQASTTLAPSTSLPASSLPASTAAEPVATSVPVTTSGPPTTVSVPATQVPRVAATLLGGKISLIGTVQTDQQKVLLAGAGGTVVEPANIDDQVQVVPAADLSEATSVALVRLISGISRNLLSGEVTWDGARLSVTGVYLTDESRAAVTQIATAVGATVDLHARRTATKADAVNVTNGLNDIVARQPTLFNKNGSLTHSALATLDQLGALSNEFSNLSITVFGYTGVDGAAQTNQQLSYAYASTVIDVLRKKGVTSKMTQLGRGSASPITENGVVNNAKSRRVLFAVSAQ